MPKDIETDPRTAILVRGIKKEEIGAKAHRALGYAYFELGETWLNDEHGPAVAYHACEKGHDSFDIWNRNLEAVTGSVAVFIVRPQSKLSVDKLTDHVVGKSDDSNINDLVVLNVADIVDDSLDTITALVEDCSVNLHCVNEGLTLRGSGNFPATIDGATERALLQHAELDPDPSDLVDRPGQCVAAQKHSGGRPPLGFTSKGGTLMTDENYQTVARTLHHVKYEAMSRSAAARKLDCAKQTIDNALDRPAMYGLHRDQS